MPRKPAPAKPAVTRDDVARLAGVSSAAVSYVINGTKKLTPETEERINAAIVKLGYRPNRAARALRLGSSETLGIVVPDSANPFFTMVVHEFELAAARRGYGLISVNGDPAFLGEQRQMETLVSRGIDGVIMCSSLAVPDTQILDAVGMPYVLFNQYAAAPGRRSIAVDLTAGASIAVEHLARHGHDAIGLIAGITTEGRQEPREVGWRAALDELGLRPGPVLWETFNPAGGYAAGREMIESGTLPSALFVSSDHIALGLLRSFHEAGIRVPEDVALVAFDGIRDAEFWWPPLTTMVQPLQDMADAAIESLLGDGTAPMMQMFEPTLKRRDSCGCVGGEWPEGHAS